MLGGMPHEVPPGMLLGPSMLPSQLSDEVQHEPPGESLCMLQCKQFVEMLNGPLCKLPRDFEHNSPHEVPSRPLNEPKSQMRASC